MEQISIEVGFIIGNSIIVEKLDTPYWLVRCNNCGSKRKLKQTSIYNLQFYKGCKKCRYKTRKDTIDNKQTITTSPYPTPEIELLKQQFICGKFDPRIQKL
jgi:hypothetical protein